MYKSLLAIFALLVMMVGQAVAYDATANFSQDKPELVSGFLIECGPTKGGPYTNPTDCGKPPLKADKTYDCALTNFTANPVYCVASNYDSTKKKIATSTEATMSIVVTPPANFKIVIVVTTVAKLNKNGNPVTVTTIKKKSVSPDVVVTEGSKSYRNARGEYVTNTTIVM